MTSPQIDTGEVIFSFTDGEPVEEIADTYTGVSLCLGERTKTPWQGNRGGN